MNTFAITLHNYIFNFDDYDDDHAAHDDDDEDQFGDEVEDDYDCVPQLFDDAYCYD